MSNAAPIIVLCEDVLHEVFIRWFIKERWGIDNRKMSFDRNKLGGSGEQYVRENYQKQLEIYRQRNSHAKTILVVVTDADTKSVQQRNAELDKAAIAQTDTGQKIDAYSRKPDEPVLHVIPRRNIETWLVYLMDKKPNEDDDYKDMRTFRGQESKAAPYIKILAKRCRDKKDLDDAPPSLIEACKEIDRIASFIRDI